MSRRTFVIGAVGLLLIRRPPKKPKTVTVVDSAGLRDALAFPNVGVYSDIYSSVY